MSVEKYAIPPTIGDMPIDRLDRNLDQIWNLAVQYLGSDPEDERHLHLAHALSFVITTALVTGEIVGDQCPEYRGSAAQ